VKAQVERMNTQANTLDDQVEHGKRELGDYSEFYSHLAIQARRASRVALLACSVALVSLISAILTQLKPPILLRVQDGKIASLDGSGVENTETAAEQQPNQSEKLAFISTFLDRFVNVDPLSVKRNTTLALNQMTNTLRQRILAQLNEQRFIDQVRDNNVTATLAVKSAELVSGDPYTAVVFGQKRVTALTNGQESKKELLVKYVLRLAPVPRSLANGWTGLQVADYKEEVLQQ
jgi:VirB8 protein